MLKITISENGIDWSCMKGNSFVQGGHLPCDPKAVASIDQNKLATMIQKAVHRDFGDIITFDEIKILNKVSL